MQKVFTVPVIVFKLVTYFLISLCIYVGCGMTGPDPSATVTQPDGVEIPLGQGVKTDTLRSSLLYNEYPFLMDFAVKLVIACSAILVYSPIT